MSLSRIFSTRTIGLIAFAIISVIVVVLTSIYVDGDSGSASTRPADLSSQPNDEISPEAMSLTGALCTIQMASLHQAIDPQHRIWPLGTALEGLMHQLNDSAHRPLQMVMGYFKYIFVLQDGFENNVYGFSKYDTSKAQQIDDLGRAMYITTPIASSNGDSLVFISSIRPERLTVIRFDTKFRPELLYDSFDADRDNTKIMAIMRIKCTGQGEYNLTESSPGSGDDNQRPDGAGVTRSFTRMAKNLRRCLPLPIKNRTS
jgi:hypothetical protein